MSEPTCQHCGHKQNPDGGWCYMFRLKPDGPCAQHTIAAESARAMRVQWVQRLAKKHLKEQP